jgi:hypothetical protein
MWVLFNVKRNREFNPNHVARYMLDARSRYVVFFRRKTVFLKRLQENARHFPLPFAAGVHSAGVGEDHPEDHLFGGTIAQFHMAVVFRVVKVAHAI